VRSSRTLRIVSATVALAVAGLTALLLIGTGDREHPSDPEDPLPDERVLTLYSPRIHSEPYVHYQDGVFLRANGREAPSRPGYITGIKEQVLVDRKGPDAKPLPLNKMMVHHLLLFSPNAVRQVPGNCFGLFGLRGEEHPQGGFASGIPRALRRRYGMDNRLATGGAPDWLLVYMVMNHYKRPKSFYVRTKVYYTDAPRTPVSPIVLGDCSRRINGMLYDVPGGGSAGSNFVQRSAWRVPNGLDGRIVLAESHQHGGAKFQTLASRSCRRRILKAPAYYGLPGHPYNTIRPILHEPGPIGNGTFSSAKGIPFHGGEVLTRAAVHDGSNLHVAAMGFWLLWITRERDVDRCGQLPRDVRDINRPRRYDARPAYDLQVPQLSPPPRTNRALRRTSSEIADDVFRPGRLSVRAGERVTWRFAGARPHSVSVANGPRGFSSLYWGRTDGTYSFTPRVPGVYRLTCLVHPTTMGQTLLVKAPRQRST
jgi:plastocyanin